MRRLYRVDRRRGGALLRDPGARRVRPGDRDLEGLGDRQRPHPVQRAFIEEQAAQCGYCLNGMIMTTKALLDRNPAPSEAEIRQALSGNLCRCGTHLEILRAVQRAIILCRDEDAHAHD